MKHSMETSDTPLVIVSGTHTFSNRIDVDLTFYHSIYSRRFSIQYFIQIHVFHLDIRIIGIWYNKHIKPCRRG